MKTQELARELAGSSKRIFALVGDLGAGKTTFAQAFLRARGVKGKITSPTFLLIKKYPNQDIYHIDAYRVDNQQELVDLGIKKILKDKNNTVLIEWADKIKNLIPKDAQWIYFKYGRNKNERIINLK